MIFDPDVTQKTVKPVEKTVKPKSLTPKKQSATMGDMETKKLITSSDKEMELAMNMIKDWQVRIQMGRSQGSEKIYGKHIKTHRKKTWNKKIENHLNKIGLKLHMKNSLVQKHKEKSEMYLMDWYEDTLSQMQRWTAKAF